MSGGNARCRSPVSKARWGKQLTSPQHKAKPAASLRVHREVGKRESRAWEFEVKAKEAVKNLEKQP